MASSTSFDWGKNASGGVATARNIYELREILENNLSVRVDGLASSDTHSNIKGTYDLYEVNNDDGIVIRLGNGNLNAYYRDEQDSWGVEIGDSYYSSPEIHGIYDTILSSNPHSAILAFNLDEIDGALHASDDFYLNNDWYHLTSGLHIEDFEHVENPYDVAIKLPNEFWEDIRTQNYFNSDFEVSVSEKSTLTSGTHIDLDQLLSNSSDLNDFAETLQDQLYVAFETTGADDSLLLNGHIGGEIRFESDESGRSFHLRMGDVNESSWIPGTSGLSGAVDPIYSEDGVVSGTLVEFGVTDGNEYQLQSFVEEVQRAAVQGFDNLTWRARDINLWGNRHVSKEPYATALANADLSFTTKALDPNIFSEEITWDIDNFNYDNYATYDFSSGELNFDVYLQDLADGLIGPSQNELQLTYRFLGSSHPEYNDHGELRINVREGYDEHLSVNFDSGNPLDKYPHLIGSSDTIDFELARVDIDGHVFPNWNDSNNTWKSAEWYIENGSVWGNHNDFNSSPGLHDVLPNWTSIKDLRVTNAFMAESNDLGAYYGSVELFNQEVIDFHYSFESQISGLELSQSAVLGDSVDFDDKFTLNISAETLYDGYNLDTVDFTINFDSNLFENIDINSINIGGEMPVANAVNINDGEGSIRIAAASLSALAGAGSGITSESDLVSIDFDFAESKLEHLDKNPDGSFVLSPLSFNIEVNDQETVLSHSIVDDYGLSNKEIVSLSELGGGYNVNGQEVTLYEAQINLEQLGDGLTLGTDRVIGSDASYTNLIRSGDTLTTSVDWLNVGNIEAKNLKFNALHNQNATLINADFSQTNVASGTFIGGRFVEDDRESTRLTADIHITGAAGNVVDLSDGIISIQADGSKAFDNTGKGSSNLITFQGDLNYDGRVSMKDLAYLNAGAARQQSTSKDPTGIDADGNGLIDTTVARDVDADFSGSIDLADLAVLDADWGKTLHTGDESFQGSSEVSWSELDDQGAHSSWDNDSFKDQNNTEAAPDYVGSLESAAASNVIGADGNTSANDGDSTATFFQETI